MMFSITSTHYANIYSPETGGMASEMPSKRYGLAFPWQDLPDRLAEIMVDQVQKAKASKWGLVNIRTNSSPRVYGMEPDNSDMILFHQRLNATNMSFESAIIHQPAQLFVSFWEKTKTANPGEIGVALNCVRFDPSKIILPAFDDLYSWRK